MKALFLLIFCMTAGSYHPKTWANDDKIQEAKIEKIARNLGIDQSLRDENIKIEEALIRLLEFQEQIARAKLEKKSIGVGAIVPVSIGMIAGILNWKKISSLRKTIRRLVVGGGVGTGVALVGGADYIIRLKEDDIEELQIEVARQVESLHREYVLNIQVLDLVNRNP